MGSHYGSGSVTRWSHGTDYAQETMAMMPWLQWLDTGGQGEEPYSVSFRCGRMDQTQSIKREGRRVTFDASVRDNDALPPQEMDSAKEQCRAADLVLCLGTSLQITPACNMPLMSIKNGGKVAIVNLQATPKDKKASLVIHGLVDKVIAGVMCILNLRIPPYIHTDFIQLSLRHTVKKKCVRWTLRVTSIHGLRAPLPFLRSIEVSFPERPDMKPVVLMEQPFSLQRETSMSRTFFMLLTLNFSDGCGWSSSSIECHVDFQNQNESFVRDRSLVLRELQYAAERQCRAGQQSILERESLPRSEISMHVFVTNFVRYDTEDFKVGSPKGTWMDSSSSNLTKRHMEGPSGYSASPKKLKC